MGKLTDAQQRVIRGHLENGRHTVQRLAYEYGVSADVIRRLRPAWQKQPPRPRLQLAGEVFGKWTVLHKAKKDSRHANRHAYWVCRCSCGRVQSVRGTNLVVGRSRQCRPCADVNCLENLGEKRRRGKE